MQVHPPRCFTKIGLFREKPKNMGQKPGHKAKIGYAG